MSDSRARLTTTGDLRTHDSHGRLIEEHNDVRVQLISPAKLESGKLIAFPTSSAVALALEIAIDSAHRANVHRERLNTTVSKSPFGPIEYYGPESEVYACIQQSMIVVAFSYQALETFCNDMLDKYAATIIKYKIKSSNGSRMTQKTARECEASTSVSTETKLTEILPQILDTPSPKGLNVWSRVKELQRYRTAVTHMKSATTNPRVVSADKIPKASIIAKFLLDEPRYDPCWMPKASIDMLKHFGVVEPWLDSLGDELTAPESF